MQRHVGVDDADARHRRQVEPARDELRTDEDVGAPLAERLPDVEIGIGSARRVAVESEHARLRPKLPHHRLEALRPHPHRPDVAAPAVRASSRHRARVAAVVANQPTKLRMLHKRDGAAEALNRLTAVAAENEGRHSAPVEVENHLLLVFQRLVDHLEQPARQRLAIAAGGLVAHVDHLDLCIASTNPPRQPGQGQLPAHGVVVGHDAGRGGAGNELGPGDHSEPARHPAGLVSRRAVLLISGRSFLVKAYEAESRDRREDGRPAAQDDVRLTAAHAPPLLSSLELGELAVEDRHRCLQPCPHPLHELRRQRDLGHEHEDAKALRQCLFGRSQVHLGLATCDDTVQER